jgi:hypothetical protein
MQCQICSTRIDSTEGIFNERTQKFDYICQECDGAIKETIAEDRDFDEYDSLEGDEADE